MTKWYEDEKDPEPTCETLGECDVKPSRSKKNTRKWCRGKVGISHIPKVVLGQYGGRWPCRVTECYDKLYIHCWHVVACQECGKILNNWPDRTQCPDLYPAP